MDINPIYLAGRFVFTGNQYNIINPWTEEILTQVSLAGKEEISIAIKSAKAAKPHIRAMSAHERYEKLLFIADRINAEKEKFAHTICRESAKPYRYASAEVDRAIQTFRVAAEESKRIPREYIGLDWTPAGKNREGLIKYFPAGIVAGITPFNFPLNLAVHKIAPALAAACPIIIKPASKTPLSCLLLAGIIDESEWPAGTISVLPMDRETGNLLVTHEEIAVLSFTGSPEVGWKMKEKAGKKKTVLELGGNAGVIVSESANIELALKKCLVGGFAYSGQICIHAQRIFVHDKLFDGFISSFTDAAKNLKYGDPEDPLTEISNMIDSENAVRVEQWISEATEQGAKCLTGGKREGSWVEPTILTGTNRSMKAHAEEVFGPVVVVEPFKTFEKAVAMINDSRFGLQAGIFTNDIREIDLAFNSIEAGGIILNDSPMLRFDHMPYGGVKDSGYGREGIKYAMLDFLEPRILVK